MVGDTTATTTTTTSTMEAESGRNGILAASHPQQTYIHHNGDVAVPSSTPSVNIEHEYDDAKCLFCNAESSDLDQNLVHMSKSHGLQIESAKLLVDPATLLAYFHFVIFVYHECLYCGTQRNTHQAVQQHMIAKGHCKYDITDEDSELRDFYDLSSTLAKDEIRQQLAMRTPDDQGSQTRTKYRKKPPVKRPRTRGSSITGPSLASTSPASQSDTDTGGSSSDDGTGVPRRHDQLSTRALKQENMLKIQVAHLRANDRRSLMHMPVSQQRALLLTHHKQMEKERRTEQTGRSNLESAGNYFGRLGTIRLIRKPPHTGRVQTLKR